MAQKVGKSMSGLDRHYLSHTSLRLGLVEQGRCILLLTLATQKMKAPAAQTAPAVETTATPTGKRKPALLPPASLVGVPQAGRAHLLAVLLV